MDTHILELCTYAHIKELKYWWLIPRMSYACWEADFIAFAPKKGIMEVELKMTWGDYKSDGKKFMDGWSGHALWTRLFAQTEKKKKDKTRKVPKPRVSPIIYKYDWLLGDYPCAWRPNYFMYAAPIKLAEKIMNDPERKKCFGVLGVIEEGEDKDVHKLEYGGTISWIKGKRYRTKTLVPAKKLMELHPIWMPKFKEATFKRSGWFMDTYFWIAKKEECQSSSSVVLPDPSQEGQGSGSSDPPSIIPRP